MNIRDDEQKYQEVLTKLDKKEVRQRVKKNSLRCRKCNTIITSTSRHDFKHCKCGAIAVDGGKEYLRRVGDLSDMEDLSEFEVCPHDKIYPSTFEKDIYYCNDCRAKWLLNISTGRYESIL